MAESIVQLLVEKLAEQFIQEAVLLHGVGDEVESLEAEFKGMQCFLKDADAKQEGDERVKNWVGDVRDVAYDAEDVIDTFLFKIATLKRRGLTRYACIFNELIARHKVASEILRINNKIDRISKRMSTYGIENIGQGAGTSSAGQSHREWRLTSPNVPEPDFVGFEEELKMLVARLTQGELRRCVVSVVGMGGLGKTTLTKKLYNADTVKKHFLIHAWISVSQEYSVKDLLQVFVRRWKVESDDAAEKLRIPELRDKISEHLNDKRYLVVLDDIWKKEAWDALKEAFPDVNNGSRVVFTTRNKDVALYADPDPLELQCLTEEESWDLFRKKLRGGCPQNMENLGREIVKNCHGLPLAIAVIGGLLSGKEPWEWENVRKSISWQFVQGEVQISGILSLSYKDLPYDLKPCFLYLANFPEDYEFHAQELIRLWAAEGFLKEREGLTLEEVGEDYLMQLVQRSMVQLAKRSSSGRIKSCRIHDLLRDLSVSEAKETKFLELQGDHGNAPPAASRARRLAIHLIGGGQLDPRADAEIFCKAIVNLNCLHHLRVSMSVPTGGNEDRALVLSLPNLSHLLKLRKLYLEGKLETLPEFPANLTKLTLRGSLLKEDPMAALEKLKNLRILKLLSASYDGGEMACSPQGFPQLEFLHLQALYKLNVWRVEEGAMPSLLHLWIGDCKQLKKLPEGMQHMTTLKKLEFRFMPDEFKARVEEDGGEDWYKIRHVPSIDIR